MHLVVQLLGFQFIQNAVLAGVLAAVLCGVLGMFVVVKRMVVVTGGISHGAFGGLGLFYLLGWPPMLGAVLVAAGSALLFGLRKPTKAVSQDAIIGVFWSVGMALGVLFIYMTPGYAPNLMSYLFGDILTVTRMDVYRLGVMVALVLVVMAALHKAVVAVAFDEVFAQVQGLPVRALTTLLMVLVAVSVILLIQVVGIILVIALFTIPPLVALSVSQQFWRAVGMAVLVGLVVILGGLAASYWANLPSGPCIVLLGMLLVAFSRLVVRYRQARADARLAT